MRFFQFQWDFECITYKNAKKMNFTFSLFLEQFKQFKQLFKGKDSSGFFIFPLFEGNFKLKVWQLWTLNHHAHKLVTVKATNSVPQWCSDMVLCRECPFTVTSVNWMCKCQMGKIDEVWKVLLVVLVYKSPQLRCCVSRVPLDFHSLLFCSVAFNWSQCDCWKGVMRFFSAPG